MTWVVGTPVPFGYSIGCADIRVTFSDGKEKDCVSKKSTRLGRLYALLSRARYALRFSFSHALPYYSSLTSRVAHGISIKLPNGGPTMRGRSGAACPVANSVSEASSCSLVHTRIKEILGRSHASIRFRSPDFSAQQILGPLQVCSLGKGAAIKTYCDPLKELWANEDLVKLEAGPPVASRAA
jgi:hypothetical protein